MTDAGTPSLAPVVVGVDDSAAARAAAHWAAAVAERQGTTLHLVHVLPPHPVFYTEPRPLPSEDEDHIAGETFLADAVRSIRADRSALAVECFLPAGSTAPCALLPLADSASMVVIGSTARGPVEGYLSATALRLAHHSRCRVVVRPETENAPDEVAARQRERCGSGGKSRGTGRTIPRRRRARDCRVRWSGRSIAPLVCGRAASRPVMISKVHCDTGTVPDQVVEFGDRYTANVPVRWCNLPRRRR